MKRDAKLWFEIPIGEIETREDQRFVDIDYEHAREALSKEIARSTNLNAYQTSEVVEWLEQFFDGSHIEGVRPNTNPLKSYAQLVTHGTLTPS